MDVPLYTITIGPVNEIIIGGFGEPTDREAAEVLTPEGLRRAVVLEPVPRSNQAPDWDEIRWRKAVHTAVSLIFMGKPVEVRWDSGMSGSDCRR
jgi:hypothetical protein